VPLARRAPELERLWQVCQLPDFRKILFEVHRDLVRDLYLRLLAGPLDDDYLAGVVAELADEGGDVDSLLARTTRLRTWAYVAHRSDWVKRPSYWRERIAELEDRLSDALHRALVDAFVERKGKTRSLPRARGREIPRESGRERAHSLAALEQFRERLAEEPAPAAGLEALADAPHTAFELDARGEISADGVPLALLCRGPSLTLPEVRVYDLPAAAGVRSRLQRRLLAFARDSVGRLLGAFEPLRSSERAPLRAIAHQLERGLGSALTRNLESSLCALDAEDRRRIAELGITLGSVGVFVPSLSSRAAVARRALFVRAHWPDLPLPSLTRASERRAQLPPAVWLALGYVVVEGSALRLDLAERAASALALGRPVPEAMRPLGLRKQSAARIAAALRAEELAAP
jgi:ATP-dependent RNA helicase SUPV3L1/SUV3